MKTIKPTLVLTSHFGVKTGTAIEVAYEMVRGSAVRTVRVMWHGGDGDESEIRHFPFDVKPGATLNFYICEKK